MKIEENIHAGTAQSRSALVRFQRLMAWMVLLAIVTVGVVITYLRMTIGPIPIHMLIATILGIGLTVLLGTALMGLVFLSSGSGHDKAVHEFQEDEEA